MNIVIPINSHYLKHRYQVDHNFLVLLENEVIPALVDRLSSDDRIFAIEIISDINFHELSESYCKLVANRADLSGHFEASEVARRIFEVRFSNDDILILLNPLYPFVKVDSINEAYVGVLHGKANSAIGALTSREAVGVSKTAPIEDIGIFTVFRKTFFETFGERVVPPVEMIGLNALELVSFRSKKDIELYELIVNSGFEIV